MKFIANLSGTVLCPYQILLDMAEQISNCPPGIRHLAFTPICELNSTNDWINLESLGKPVAVRAKALSDLICTTLKKQAVTTAVITVYLGNNSLTSDNLYSLLYLAETLDFLQVAFLATPDIIETLKAKTACLAANAQVTIADAADFHEPVSMQLKANRFSLLKTYGFSFNDDFLLQETIPDAELNQLIGFSWLCLKAGCYDTPCRLLEQAGKHPKISREKQEHLFMHLLFMRFFSHQYAAVAESEFPEHFDYVEASEVTALQFLAAYSATLSRNLPIAKIFFNKCGINEQMPLTDENSLYRLNLFALSKVLQGEIDTAFELEFRIKAFIAEHNIDTVGLKYVNFINIARLYKKIKDYDLSLQFYTNAYNEISGGGYSSSDHIYYNINLGSLYEAADDNQTALAYWIKAALHWLACSNKYELSWRPRLVLCQEKITDIINPLPVNKANQFLIDKITSLLQTCEINLAARALPACRFIDDSDQTHKQQCHINHDIVLFTSRDSQAEPARRAESEQQLATLVLNYLHSIMAITDDQNLFIVDTQLDNNFLTTAEQAIAFANLANCERCYFNGSWLDKNQVKAEQPPAVSLSKVIQSISQSENGLAIKYKRSFLNKILRDSQEIDVVKQLQQPGRHDVGRLPLGVVAALARKRVLNIEY
ncbi:hypothetical protein ACFORL_09205 [Legionella dresdenensis]|uniref:Tetratricopeptide repeat protein n=1 Tax=Legionella dresdenensis TaxID=450200 RepID=A0ABV8CG27_9GAMM